MNLKITRIGQLKETHRAVVVATVVNLGLDSLFMYHGVDKDKSSPGTIAYRTIELLMDGLGDESKAEDAFIDEYNSMVELLAT